MHESGAVTWREVVDKHYSHLVDELSGRLDSDLREAVSGALAAEREQAGVELKRACEEARRSQVESLNQVLRRLRETGPEHVLDLVAEGCAAFAGQLVVLVFESNQARCAASFGMERRNGALSLDTNSAPAIVAAVDSRDPVVALATEREISPVLAEAFGPAPDRKAYLFPIVARHTVVAMLVASGVAVSAPIELLCAAAGMRLETTLETAQQASTTDLVHPAGADGQPAGMLQKREAPRPRAWADLTAEDQKLHLQAQRVARLRVAEMRLYHEDEVRAGVASGDIYGALQSEIDAARRQFLQAFLSKSPTMVDYLHLEILRSLAHDDDRLLGHNYPGPMV